jgi:hypothetical protein
MIEPKKDGVYVYKDWEIAKMSESTIASVQAWRRKVNLIHRLYKKLNTRPARQDEYLPLLMRSSETSLRSAVYKKDSSIQYIIKTQRYRKKNY